MIHYGPYEWKCKEGIPAEAVTRTDAKGDVWVLYIPTDKGKVYHAERAPFVLGEGGRGSAKSTILRWDAHLRNITIPGHRALLLRRTFPQLRGSHFAFVAREGKLFGEEICPKPFNSSKFYLEYSHGGTKPPSILQFGHCESDSAVNDYLSQEWDWIGFDELTTFTFDQFIRISMSNRSVIDSGKLSLIRAATNPIGEGASWVKRYFIDHSVTEEENPEYMRKDWVDIKMNVEDNPFMDAKAYRAKLAYLPNETLRRAYMDGEWLVEGAFFPEFKERWEGKPWHVVNEMPKIDGVPLHQLNWIQITRFVDWGYSAIEPGYVGWIAHLPDGTAIQIAEWVFTGRTPEQVAQIMVEKSKGMNIRFTVGDPMMWAEREGVSIAYRFASNGVSMIRGTNEREGGWVGLHSWLNTTTNDGSGARPRLQFLAPQEAGTGLGCPYMIRTLPTLQTDPKKPGDMLQPMGCEDHGADALRYWACQWPAPSHAPVKTLDWVAPELRRMMAEALGGGSDTVLGSESVRSGGGINEESY